MSFYHDLSAYYDEIFSVDEAEMAFIAGLFNDNAILLDLGCGTGNKTTYFSEHVAHITAIDADREMITTAQKDNARPNIEYFVKNMQEIGHTFSGQVFNGILCLGNTLVHLPTPQEIQQQLTSLEHLLAPDGILVLQILNYDRILDNAISELPVLDTSHVRFIRKYQWQDDGMRFVTELHVKETGAVLHNTTTLYPLRKAALDDMLRTAGFTNNIYFGGYAGTPHHADSFVTIACCRKI